MYDRTGAKEKLNIYWMVSPKGLCRIKNSYIVFWRIYAVLNLKVMH